MDFVFSFLSNEGNEPIHIHIEKADCYAKFWLDPVVNVANYGFNSKELRLISEVIDDNKELFKLRWNEYFSK